MFAGCNTQLHQKAPPELHPLVAGPVSSGPLGQLQAVDCVWLWAALWCRVLPQSPSVSFSHPW